MSKVVMREGVERETLASGKHLMVIRVTFKKGSGVPWHAHAHEQSSYIEKGQLKLLLMEGQEEKEILLNQGMSAIVLPNVKHKAIAMEDTVDINSFTPIREDYL
jgi:quercetin dioxygenase-like cupin family protein